MYVEFGNDNAIEGYREGDSDEVKFRPLEGQRVTTIGFPEGMTLQEAFTTAVAQANYHFAVVDEETGERAKPKWIESDSPGLKALLCEHFGLKPDTTMPKTWGKDTGLEQDNLLSVAARRESEGDDK